MQGLQELTAAVRAAADRPAVREAVASLYSTLQNELDARRPLCVASGRCCRFEEFGHRLYVTTLELAAFVHELARRPTAADPAFDGGGCPFQVARLCGVHAFRPFGCRMFFCDATATEWQNQTYEHFHARLKQLHESLGVPYFYVEWRAALDALGLLPPASRGGPLSDGAGNIPLPLLQEGGG